MNLNDTEVVRNFVTFIRNAKTIDVAVNSILSSVTPATPAVKAKSTLTKLQELYTELGTYSAVADEIGCSITQVGNMLKGDRSTEYYAVAIDNVYDDYFSDIAYNYLKTPITKKPKTLAKKPTLRERLRNAMNGGEKQISIAEYMGVHPTTLSKFLNGWNELSKDNQELLDEELENCGY